MAERRDSHAPAASRRAEERLDVRWSVDCASEETFLYAYITNVCFAPDDPTRAYVTSSGLGRVYRVDVTGPVAGDGAQVA